MTEREKRRKGRREGKETHESPQKREPDLQYSNNSELASGREDDSKRAGKLVRVVGQSVERVAES